jgi:hypothetical protein
MNVETDRPPESGGNVSLGMASAPGSVAGVVSCAAQGQKITLETLPLEVRNRARSAQTGLQQFLAW